MSPHVFSQHSSSGWWSRPRSSPKDKASLPNLSDGFGQVKLSDPPPRKPVSKFNTLASVIGLKPKKHVIAVQNPPQPLSSPIALDPYPKRSSRLRSKAVSSITTAEDDVLEPRTPSDPCLSDVPFTSQDADVVVPKRLSVFGASKPNGSVRKRMISESSVSGARSRLLTNLTTRNPIVSKGAPELSSNSHHIDSDVVSAYANLNNDGALALAASNATSPMRPRGMTDAGLDRPRKSSDPSSLRPSLTRIVVPLPNLSSPPSAVLPPLPSPKKLDSPKYSPAEALSHSASPSSLSFASSVSEELSAAKSRGPIRNLSKSPDEQSNLATSPHRNAHRESEASTHRSLYKKPSDKLSSLTTPVAEGHHEYSSKSVSSLPGLKQQRSFHRTRLPIPTLRHATSFHPSETSTICDDPHDKEKETEKDKRRSVTPATRRCILPLSTPSSQTHTSAASDELESIRSSLSTAVGSSITNVFASPGSASIILTPNNVEHPGSLNSNQDRNEIEISIPQHIISPADMLKLEALINIEEDTRKRTAETSSSHMQAVDDYGSLEDVHVRGNFRMEHPRGNSSTDSITSSTTTASSTFFTRLAAVPIATSDRQWTEQGRFVPTSEPTRSWRSLLQRPERRTSVHGLSEHHDDDESPICISLPPPPRPATVSRPRTTTHKRSSESPIQSLPPPINQDINSRKNESSTYTLSSVEQRSVLNVDSLLRRSLTRKPSFLDIEDEIEADMMNTRSVWPDMSYHDDSFLDLSRGDNSFDTIRTSSAEFPG